MPQSVIDRLNAKLHGQPTNPVFMDHLGNAIRDVAFDVGTIETVEMGTQMSNFQECIYLRLTSLSKSQEWIRIRSLSYLNQMLTSELILTILHLKNYLWPKWSLPKRSLSKSMMLFAGQPECVSSQPTTNLP